MVSDGTRRASQGRWELARRPPVAPPPGCLRMRSGWFEADRLQHTARIASQWMEHALRVVVEFVVVASLDAAVPVIHGIVYVADDVDDTALLERDFQSAGGVAETADGSRFNHGLPASVRGGRGGAPCSTPPLAVRT